MLIGFVARFVECQIVITIDISVVFLIKLKLSYSTNRILQEILFHRWIFIASEIFVADEFLRNTRKSAYRVLYMRALYSDETLLRVAEIILIPETILMKILHRGARYTEKILNAKTLRSVNYLA